MAATLRNALREILNLAWQFVRKKWLHHERSYESSLDELQTQATKNK